MTALRRWLEEAKRRGLIGPEALEQTVEHSRGLGVVLRGSSPPDGAYLDLGSGGGVPGLILACEWDSSRWTLLDSNLRSAEFLREAVGDLDLAGRVSVMAERAEAAGRDVAHRGAYAAVLARSVAPPAVVGEYSAPLLQPGGLAVISEPAGVERTWDPDGLALLGLLLEARTVDPVAAAVLRRTAEDIPERFPRRPGVARKRPLW